MRERDRGKTNKRKPVERYVRIRIHRVREEFSAQRMMAKDSVSATRRGDGAISKKAARVPGVARIVGEISAFVGYPVIRHLGHSPRDIRESLSRIHN